MLELGPAILHCGLLYLGFSSYVPIHTFSKTYYMQTTAAGTVYVKSLGHDLALLPLNC